MTYEELYKLALSQGCTPKMADMLASRQPSGVRGTDRAFMQRRNNNEDLDRMPKEMRSVLLDEARRAGVSISGKTYCSGLARRPNDPSAWVGGRDEVLAKCRDNGWSATGSVNYRGTEQEPPYLKPK